MKKLWAKNYLVLSSLIVVILVAICSLALVSRNISQAESKHVFESIYVDTSIDFIIPSPGNEQPAEMESNASSGIEAVTPYYETSTSVDINGSTITKGSVLLFPDVSRSEYTPYSEARIVSGASATAGTAIVDTIYAETNGCKIGDVISIDLVGQTYSFMISSVAMSNTYSKDGSVALFLSEDQAAALQEAGIKYSAAYVKASSYEACKSYLYNEYKPLGRLKDQSEFDSEDTYNQHVANFNEADWTQEITNCLDNYDELKIKYTNVETGIWINIGIYAVIVFMAVVILNMLLLRKESIRQFMRTFLIKKSGTKAEIAGFYSKGIVYDMVLFIVISIAAYILLIMPTTLPVVSINAVNAAIPVGADILSSIIMLSVSKSYVKKNYTIPKNASESASETAESATAK